MKSMEKNNIYSFCHFERSEKSPEERDASCRQHDKIEEKGKVQTISNSVATLWLNYN